MSDKWFSILLIVGVFVFAYYAVREDGKKQGGL